MPILVRFPFPSLGDAPRRSGRPALDRDPLPGWTLMRIVHTSDWHAGRIWKSQNRLDELRDVLDHLGDFIERERIDLLLMSGDMFDNPVPPRTPSARCSGSSSGWGAPASPRS